MENKIKGTLWVEISAKCPHCRESFNLFDVDYLNDEGQLWNLLADFIKGEDRASKDIDKEFDCPECNKTLIFDELEY